MSRRSTPPQLWLGWCECILHLSIQDAILWWQALSQTNATPAASLRNTVLYHATQRHRFPTLMALSRQVLIPQVLVASLESCVEKGTLARQHATRLEEAVFARMRQGHWRGDGLTVREILGEVVCC